jgi:hypothetical protein
LLLVRDLFVDLVIESFRYPFVVFLGSVSGSLDLGGDLDLLAVTVFRISKVRELLSEVGEVTTLFLFFAFLLRLWQ